MLWLGIFLRSQREADQLHVRRRPDPDRSRLRLPLPSRVARPRTQLLAAALILVGYWAAFALYPLPPPVRHEDGGRPARLAAPRDGLCRALGQEHERSPPGRPMVPEPVPARAAVRVQWRRLSDAQFRAIAGDDDLRPARRRRPPWRAPAARQAAPSRRVGRCRHRRLASSSTRSGSVRSSSASGRRHGRSSAAAGSCCSWRRTTTSSIWPATPGRRASAFPFLVIGANSIAMYVLVHVATDYITRSLVIHFGTRPFETLWRGLRPRAPRSLHARDLLVHPAVDVPPPRVRPHMTVDSRQSTNATRLTTERLDD